MFTFTYTPGISQIRQLDMTDTQAILTIIEYSYEGETPICDEGNARSRIKAIRDYVQIDPVSSFYGPCVKLTVVHSTATPLTEEVVASYRTNSAYVYNDWNLNEEKIIGSRLITSVGVFIAESFLKVYSYTKK